jgi:heme/copper-type cytochrome/quinol oxidase subunit 4
MIADNALTTTAWFAFAVAVVTVVGLALLIIMYLLGEPFGTLNDICNAVAALLSAAMALMLFPLHHARSPQLAVAALILAVAGAVIAVVGSALVMSKTTGFVLAGLYLMVGNALIGLWLLSLNHGSPWPQGLITFGLITGAVMALGLAAIPGIFMGIDSLTRSPWHTWVGQAGFIGWAILYPVWCLRLWHALRTA